MRQSRLLSLLVRRLVFLPRGAQSVNRGGHAARASLAPELTAGRDCRTADHAGAIARSVATGQRSSLAPSPVAGSRARPDARATACWLRRSWLGQEVADRHEGDALLLQGVRPMPQAIEAQGVGLHIADRAPVTKRYHLESTESRVDGISVRPVVKRPDGADIGQALGVSRLDADAPHRARRRRVRDRPAPWQSSRTAQEQRPNASLSAARPKNPSLRASTRCSPARCSTGSSTGSSAHGPKSLTG